MDTSDTVDVSDGVQNNVLGDERQNPGMDTSPILERRINRHIRVRRDMLSLRRQSHVPEADSSSSNPQAQVSVEVPESPNQENIILDAHPPPIEDTDLIMIHRPLSPTVPDNELQGAAIIPQEANYQNMDITSEALDPQPEALSGDNSLESVALDQEADAAGETSQDEDDLPGVVTVPPAAAAPDIENLPLAQRIRSPDLLPPERSPPSKKVKVEPEPPIKNETKEESDEEEEGRLCPICFDAWTNSGDHRLVCLRCGHLFGKHCIEHWLQIHKPSDRKCPQCKKKATAKDIRPLYASKLRVVDTSEQEALKETIKKLEEEKESLSRELTFAKQQHLDAVKIQHEQQLKLQELQSKGILSQSVNYGLPATSKEVAAVAAQIKISQTARIEVSRDGGCRVLAFNEWKGVLVASQSQVTPLFPDFGIRFIDTQEFRLRQIIPLHAKSIRDLSFNPHRKDLLLSVSLDKTAKVFCMSSNSSVMTFNSEVPLWSCCWDGNNSNIFFAGSQNGITFQYDIRNIHTEVSRIATPGDGTPVISLSALPAGSWLPHGGFLSCRLQKLRVYERASNSEFRASPLSIEGPFSALNYDLKTHHMLISTKPTAQNPHAQHQLYEMGMAGAQPQANIVHSFMGGTTQRVLSRPCQVEIDDGNVKDTLVCAHQESEGNVAIWSVRSGQKIPAGPLICSDVIMDLCPIRVNNRTFLASLSEKSLRVYQFSS